MKSFLKLNREVANALVCFGNVGKCIRFGLDIIVYLKRLSGCLVGIAFLVVGTLTVAQGQHVPGSNDASFNTVDAVYGAGEGINDVLKTIAMQPDGKIVLGGGFTKYNGTERHRLARLNADGSLDTSFYNGFGFNDWVYAIVLQPDDKIIVGGVFTSFNGVSRNGIARLNADGTLDTTFNPGSGFNKLVHAMALQPDGKIIVVGLFSSFNGTGRVRIARLNNDGSLDASFNPGSGFDHSVYAVAIQPDNKILVGGNFEYFNGAWRKKLARLNSDGSLDESFHPGTTLRTSVFAIALQSNGKILVADVTMFTGIARNTIVRLNDDGTHDASFNTGTGFNSYVSDFVLQPDGKLVVVGNFSSYNGVSRNYIARLNADGSLDDAFNPGASSYNYHTVQSLARQPDGKILVAGNFRTYSDVDRLRISRLNADGTLDNAFDFATGFNKIVKTMVQQPDGQLLVGGAFTSHNGLNYNRIARLNANGTLDGSFNTGTGFNWHVESIALQPDGKIVVGGSFRFYQGIQCNRIARLHADGTLDASINPVFGFDNAVNSLVLQPDGKIVVGGKFSFFNGHRRERIIRLDADGELDFTFTIGSGFNNEVYSVVLQPDGKILVGGVFTSYNGTGSNYVARLNADGSYDSSFNTGSGFNNAVRKIVLQPDGKIIIGGNFTSLNGTMCNRIARLHADGTRDTSFNISFGFDNEVHSVVLQPDGKIMVGGKFTSFNLRGRYRIARLNADGSLDASYSTNAGFDEIVNSMVLQPDGKLMVGGDFLTSNNIPRRRIARLHGDDGAALSTAKDLYAQPEVVLYPNPSQGDINLEFPGAAAMVGGAALKLYNAMGRQVLTRNVTAAEAQAGVKLATTGLASGVYFLSISTRSGVVTKRVVLAH